MTRRAGVSRTAFVVRIWRRHLAADDPWVGRITRLSTGASRSFVTVEELGDFITAEMDRNTTVDRRAEDAHADANDASG